MSVSQIEDKVREIEVQDVLKIPIAETFTSVQGEGAQSGMRMTFFRLAGCTVGKRYPKGYYKSEEDGTSKFPMLPSYVNMCSTFDGKGHFPCDTNYNLAEKVSIDDLLSRIPDNVKWVSITGGEPLMHMDKVIALCKALRTKDIYYHIETSATIIPDESIIDTEYCYLACSPKANWIPQVITIADEIRLMVDKDFDIEAAKNMLECRNEYAQVFLSPLSLQDDINHVDRASMAMCLKLIETDEFCTARISLQIHKALGVR